MPGVIIPGQSTTTASRVNPYLVYLRQQWADDWEHRQELLINEMTDATGHQDIGRLVLRRPYGRVMRHFDPPGSDYRTVLPQDLCGWWVKVEILGDNNQPILVWQGRIFDESRDLGGRDVVDQNDNPVHTGMQIFTAYAGLNILRRIHVSTSDFYAEIPQYDEQGEETGTTAARRRSETLEPMNRRDKRNMLVGNRSEEKDPDEAEESDKTYLHGGHELWDRAQYLRYLLARHVNRSDTPEWSLSGEVIMLQEMTDAIDFGDSATADEMARALIDPRYGMDFKVIPTADGFTISVFSLLAEAFAWGDKTLEANVNWVNVDGDNDVSLERKHIVRSKDHLYERIRVIGRPIVVCFSLFGSDAQWKHPPAGVTNPPLPNPDDSPLRDYFGSLVPGWSETLENQYLAGTGTPADDAEDHDRAREKDIFDTVLQLFVCRPGWDFHRNEILPRLNPQGELVGLQGRQGLAEFQDQSKRSTLTWLPLLEGVRYQEPITNLNVDGSIPDFMRPQAWVWDENADPARYVGCEKVGIHVSVSKTDWGVFLQARPNHLLALHVFRLNAETVRQLNEETGEEEEVELAANAADSETEPLYDPAKIICTIAIELDARLSLIYAPGVVTDNSEIVIEVPDAEFWYLAPRTMTGVKDSGLPQLSPDGGDWGENPSGETSGRQRGTVLRNDADRLAQVMAGAIARYRGDRARAELWFRGTRPFGNYLGFILGVVQQGGDIQHIKAPITSVEWRFSNGEPFTVVRTGHAQ